MSLIFIRPDHIENAGSPEFRFLLSQMKRELTAVFGHVEIVERINSISNNARYVLLTTANNLLFTAFSLDQMKKSLDGGCDVAIPSLINSIPLAEPLFTLRDYEEAERRILSERRTRPTVALNSTPIAMFNAASFRMLLERFGFDALVTMPDLVSQANLKAACDGVYYQFADYYGQVREDILKFIPPGAVDILEVGCARGLTGQLIQERFQCRVTGVEMNRGIALEASQRLHRVIEGDVMVAPLHGLYDAVIATELFEHLTDPLQFIERMRAVLKPGGRIILSVPNVGHYSVVEDLLAGRWDYLLMGLLCVTHFRFFTRTTLESWLEQAGVYRYQIIPQHTELPERINALTSMIETDLESLCTHGFYVIMEF